jgi:hypothetical protein
MSEPANNAGADQLRATWYRGTLDAVVLAFTLACGVAATWYAYSAAETTHTRQRQEQFNAAAQSVVDSFYLDLVRSVEVVRATGLMVATSRGSAAVPPSRTSSPMPPERVSLPSRPSCQRRPRRRPVKTAVAWAQRTAPQRLPRPSQSFRLC